jgi:hypothetical protein
MCIEMNNISTYLMLSKPTKLEDNKDKPPCALVKCLK